MSENYEEVEIPDLDPDALAEDDFDAAIAQAAAEDTPASAPNRMREPLKFEGKPVDRMEVKITGVKGLSEAYDQVKVNIHDRVRLVVETRVKGISHYLDKDNQLVRLQEVVATAVDIVPWNPADPSDDGVLRG